MLRSGEAPLGFRQAPPPPVPMPMSHFLVRPRRAAATRTNAAIDASRRGANVNFCLQAAALLAHHYNRTDPEIPPALEYSSVTLCGARAPC